MEFVGGQTTAELFGDLKSSMMTLTVCVTDGCVGRVARPMVQKDQFLLIFWTCYVIGPVLGLMSLIVGPSENGRLCRLG